MDRQWKTYHGEELIDSGSHDVTWDEVRRERDQALADSDWTAVKDRSMSQEWKDYRTALRDIPQDHASANDAVDNWPEAPE
tara:strand:- start:190 stop:432 length:243 start_codon:yes stop_codon:yes gene_type:complete